MRKLTHAAAGKRAQNTRRRDKTSAIVVGSKRFSRCAVGINIAVSIVLQKILANVRSGDSAITENEVYEDEREAHIPLAGVETNFFSAIAETRCLVQVRLQ
jgi:hypothetical protein